MATPNRTPHFFLTLLSLCLFFPLSTSSANVHDVLPQYGLPSGLLPSSVTRYTLDEEGNFVVELEKECYVRFEYLVYYDKRITGKLSYGSISNLKGIQVRSFLLWLNVDEIKVDLPPSDSIYFQVGIINKRLDVDQFKDVPSCRDRVKGACGGRLWSQILELSAPSGEVQMLLTE